MKKKYISELADLYTGQVINENEDNRVWKTGDCPEAFGDSPHAEAGLKPDDSGPNGAEGTKSPVDHDDKEGISNDNISQKKEKAEKKEENLKENDINNSTMSKPNIFDKLYATIMEAEDLDDENFDLGGMGDEESDLDELGVEDEGGEIGDEITLSLPRELAEKLHEALMSQLDSGDDLDDLGGEEDDLDFGGEDDGFEEEPMMEASDGTAPAGSGSQDGGKPKKHTATMPHGKPGDNKVGGENTRPSGGSADGSAGGEEDGGKPKKQSGVMPHGKPGDNKVGSGEWGK